MRISDWSSDVCSSDLAVETVLDNGKFGTRTVKFETGLLARQAAGSVTAYLDTETMLLSPTRASNNRRTPFASFPPTTAVKSRWYAPGKTPTPERGPVGKG